MRKNTSGQKVSLLVIDSATSRPKTGDAANLTAYVSIDGGTVTALTDTSATEMDATNAKGLYFFDLTQAETNGDHLLFSGKSSTSGVDVVPQLFVTFPATGVLAPTVADRTLDVNSDGEAGVDWANVGGQSTTVNLSATTVKTVTDAPSDSSGITTLLSRIGGSITITAGRVASDMTHIAGSAVSTSTAQIGVNVVNAAGTAWASGAITSGVFAASSITASALASDAATEIATAVGALVCDTGVTLLKSGEMIAALCAGQLTSTSGAGTQTLEYMKRDGVTPSFNTVVNMADKTRSTTGSLS